VIARPLLGVAVLAAGGCATKGMVRQVETQIHVLRTENARQDSARAAELARVIRLQQQMFDSLNQSRQAIRLLDVKFGNDVTDVLRQLLAIQEMTGQSQRRLTELKAQLDARAEVQDARPIATQPDSSAAVSTAPTASADQIYQAALEQHRRGNMATARRGFLDFLQQYPNHPGVPDALHFLGETYESAAPDSAVARWNEVVTRFPRSPRAPESLFKLGLTAERRGDLATARVTFQRLVKEYPRSEHADLARDRLKDMK
jgi:tol-pal system protein YbgF